MSTQTTEQVGQEVRPLEHVVLTIGGMTCSSCAARIERKLNRLDGVTATVNLATETAAVDYDPQATDPQTLMATVEATGYTAHPASAARPERRIRGCDGRPGTQG